MEGVPPISPKPEQTIQKFGSLRVLIILGILAVISSGLGFYSYFGKTAPTTEDKPQANTTDVAIYKNDKYGFEVSYLKRYHTEVSSTNGSEGLFILGDDKQSSVTIKVDSANGKSLMDLLNEFQTKNSKTIDFNGIKAAELKFQAESEAADNIYFVYKDVYYQILKTGPQEISFNLNLIPDWKTYENQNFEFQLKYPSTYTVNFDPSLNPNLIIVRPVNNFNGLDDVSINVFTNTDKKTIEQIYADDLGNYNKANVCPTGGEGECFTPAKPTWTEVGGVKAIYELLENGGLNELTIATNQKIYSITWLPTTDMSDLETIAHSFTLDSR